MQDSQKPPMKRKTSDKHLPLLEFAAMVGSTDISTGSKIKKFLKRNRERNAELYELPKDREGIDFVVCPVLGIRTLNIKKLYIEGVLGMTEEEFSMRFPGVQRSCDGHSSRISKGLQEEISPGVTKHAASVVKATEVRATVGADGLSINQRKGQKTRETHMQRDENGLNGWERLAKHRNETILNDGRILQQHALDKRLQTMMQNGRTFRKGSKAATKALGPILSELRLRGEKFYFEDTEYGIKTRHNYYFFDPVIPKLALCIEYQSKAYHPNPAWEETRWNAWRSPFNQEQTPEQKYQYDIGKARDLWTQRRFSTWFVWEETAQADVDMLLDFLKEELDGNKSRI